MQKEKANSNSIPKKETGQDNVSFTPIGFFHTNYTPDTGGPRQGVLRPDGKGEIHILNEYREALKDLGLFEYIIVLYHFDTVGKWAPRVNPPAATHEHNFGLFSTRSPKRPNPIGLSIIKLEKIEDGVLFVSGIDAFDGSPVLDIKPYLPSIDCIKSIQNEQIEKYLGHHDEDFITDKKFFR